AITIPSVLIGVYLRRLYSAGLFLGTPFTIGYISAYVFNARQAQSARHTLEVAVLAVALAGGAMLVFALEGALCIALALPLASSDPAWGRPATATSRPAARSSRSRFGRRVAGWDSTSRRSRRPCASGARIAT